MNSKVYKCCAVPQCENTSIKTPDKVFVFVPHKKTIRNKWLKLARRDSTGIMHSTHLYFCEDHFDMPNDMENYMEYHLMGSVSQVRMKPGCMPSRFQCQSDRRKRNYHATKRSYVIKKQRKTLIEECEKVLEEKTVATKQMELGKSSSGNSVPQANIDHIPQEDSHKTVNKSTRVNMTSNLSRKPVQTELNVVNQMPLPLEPFHASVSTSSFKSVKPSTSTLQTQRNLVTIQERPASDFTYTLSSSSSTISLQTKSTSDCSKLIEGDKKQEASKILEYTVVKIMKNPLSHIGIPKSCYYMIKLIEQKTRIPANHILMCLKKNRLNNPFRELAYDFSMTPTYAKKIFLKNIPLIANLVRPLIIKLDKNSIKQCLPMAFRNKYQNVSCIIDCLEIEVQKPSKAIYQSLSWSEYKKGNTIKYLVSCTPNGLVNYISPGYGGRITDTLLVESCDFIKCLEPGMCVMADREFKNLEQYLQKKGVQLVRPPSVTTSTKLLKNKTREIKQIASLRMHVEKVIRQLHEFNMLNACVNHKLLQVLDDVVTISCSLINLQNSFIT